MRVLANGEVEGGDCVDSQLLFLNKSPGHEPHYS